MPISINFIFGYMKMKRISFKWSHIPYAQLSLLVLGMALWSEMELLVPSLPAMRSYFAVSEGQIQQVLSANFIGFLLGVFLAGPLCDGFGRRSTTLWGMAMFLLASTLVSIADGLPMMIFARLLQGFFVTAPIIGGITMLFEVTKRDEQVLWMSISSTSITCAIASAPIIGTIINEGFGFRGNLWSIVVAGLIAIVPVYAMVPETLDKEKRTKIDLKNVLNNYWKILTDSEFMNLAAAVSAPVAGYWVYAGASSLYLIDYVGISSGWFGVYQGAITGTFALVSLSFSFLHKRFGSRMCIWAGFYSMLFAIISLLGMALLDIRSAITTSVLMMAFSAGVVPTNNLLFPMAIQHLPQNLQGSGQSIIQSLRLLLSAIGTVFLGLAYKGPFLPIAIFLLLMFIVSSVLIWRSRADLTGAQHAIG